MAIYSEGQITLLLLQVVDMGQSHIKMGLQIQKQARDVVSSVTSHFSNTTQLKALTYDQFVHEVELLNQM